MVAKKSAPLKMPKVPANIGAAIDMLDMLRDKRKAIEAQAAEVKRQEAAFEDAIFHKFKKGDLEGARGRSAQASISRSDVPTMEDPRKLYAYIRKTGDFDLLQQRLATNAVRERWAAKKTVPGVGVFQKISLHLSKVKAKVAVKSPRKK